MKFKVSGEIEGTVDGGRSNITALTATDLVEDFFCLFILHACSPGLLEQTSGQSVKRADHRCACQ
jgi:hypothetical protein